MERSVEIGDDFGCNFSSLNVKYASYITSKGTHSMEHQ